LGKGLPLVTLICHSPSAVIRRDYGQLITVRFDETICAHAFDELVKSTSRFLKPNAATHNRALSDPDHGSLYVSQEKRFPGRIRPNNHNQAFGLVQFGAGQGYG